MPLSFVSHSSTRFTREPAGSINFYLAHRGFPMSRVSSRGSSSLPPFPLLLNHFVVCRLIAIVINAHLYSRSYEKADDGRSARNEDEMPASRVPQHPDGCCILAFVRINVNVGASVPALTSRRVRPLAEHAAGNAAPLPSLSLPRLVFAPRAASYFVRAAHILRVNSHITTHVYDILRRCTFWREKYDKYWFII